MLVTVAGMVIDVNFDAYWNASFPMLVTPDGMIMEVNADAPWNT